MRIVIVGDGKIGSALAEQLSREGHEITIVDRSGTPLQRTEATGRFVPPRRWDTWGRDRYYCAPSMEA